MSRRLELVDLFLALAATSMTEVLIIFALVALVDAHASVAMVAGTVVGVLPGISATSDVGYELGNMIRASVSISGFLHMLDADSAASSHADSRVDSAAPAKVVGLDMDDLSAFYDQERRIGVSGVSIHARKGQIVAFVGRNGAGKTTTVKALTGMLAPEQGIITLALEGGEKGTPQGRNLDLGSMVFFSRRPYMSVMVQDYNRFELTVRQTWLWGRFGISLRWRGRSPKSRTAGSCGMLWTRSGRRRSWRGSHRESILSWAPQWDGVDVSGGQWQRLTLARALAAQAPVLILDEPTSNVDSQSEEEILRNLVRYKQGRITILVTHWAWTLKSAYLIYVFEAGRIVDQGTYESLCEHSKVLQDLFELQIKAGRGPDDADACSDEAGMKGLPSV